MKFEKIETLLKRVVKEKEKELKTFKFSLYSIKDPEELKKKCIIYGRNCGILEQLKIYLKNGKVSQIFSDTKISK